MDCLFRLVTEGLLKKWLYRRLFVPGSVFIEVSPTPSRPWGTLGQSRGYIFSYRYLTLLRATCEYTRYKINAAFLPLSRKYALRTRLLKSHCIYSRVIFIPGHSFNPPKKKSEWIRARPRLEYDVPCASTEINQLRPRARIRLELHC